MRKNIHRCRFAGIVLSVAVAFAWVGSSSLIIGCSHPVAYDTVVHHDTIPGPAFLRFISMFNAQIILRQGGSANPDFTQVSTVMTKEFFAVPHDSTFVLYANYYFKPGMQKLDSITIPALKPFSMTTVAIFESGDTNNPVLFPKFADDSARRKLPPPDSCSIRFINGLPDYPQPQALVNMHLDNINAPPLFPSQVIFSEIKNYIIIPAGIHTIYIRSETDITQSYSLSFPFVAGEFYTARLIGRHADKDDQLIIDAE